MANDVQLLQSYQSDMTWFYSNYNTFKEDFRNQFVLVKDKQVILHAATLEDLKEKATKEKIGLVDSLIKFIPSKDLIIIL